jgi:hypothetical protein
VCLETRGTGISPAKIRMQDDARRNNGILRATKGTRIKQEEMVPSNNKWTFRNSRLIKSP